MKSKAAGCGSISAVISSIVLLCVSSIIIVIIKVLIIVIIFKIILTTVIIMIIITDHYLKLTRSSYRYCFPHCSSFENTFYSVFARVEVVCCF